MSANTKKNEFRARGARPSHISVRGARQHNLKGLDLDLPLNKIIAVTGVSGSGKSSLAFDTVHAEGQRRYVETFSPYARQFLDRMDKPAVERVDGIPPSIAIDQTNPIRASRSTVGTMSELNDHLKLLFARVAVLYCGKCGRPVRGESAQTILENVFREHGGGPEVEELAVAFPVRIPENYSEQEIRDTLARKGYQLVVSAADGSLEVIQDTVALTESKRRRIAEALEAALRAGRGEVILRGSTKGGARSWERRFSSELRCADCGITHKKPSAGMFSFNSPIGACETCRGFGRTIGIDYNLVVPDPNKTLAGGAIKPWQSESYGECQDDLKRFARLREVPLDTPWKDLAQRHRKWVLDGEGEWEDGCWYGVKRFFDWLEGRSYRMHIRVLLSRYRTYRVCQACGGARLKPESLLWRIGPERLNIHDLALLPIEQCRDFFERLNFPPPMDKAAELLLHEIRTRLGYLVEVGLGYLCLDRQSRTLSGGEAQRINLTTALGSSLVNTLFVLDEPSIGLHPRDIHRLIAILRKLRDAGNTLLIVEHDPQVMAAADMVVDLGPGPGERGGEIVFAGPLKKFLRSRRSLTARYLSGAVRHSAASAPQLASASPATGRFLEVLGASEHNLKGIDVKIPLNRLVCVTGVSGSGKSTLVQDVIWRALLRLKNRPADEPGAHREICGHEHIGDVALVDQSPLGKTTRSNPASYVGALDPIRKIFAAQPEAVERGYGPAAFSFNSSRGKCPACGGNGFERVEMQFLSDVYLRCQDCGGKRFRPEILEVKIGGEKSISDVLEMTVSEALTFFDGHPDALRALEPLREAGLEYMRLGQPSPTLSGGEAQRLKLAGRLAGAGSGARGTLFLFDEPTTGLHFADVERLIAALRKLLARGHSIVVVEHNLDVIRAADWLIDLGPEGGEAGGEIVCEGPPAAVAASGRGHTAAALKTGAAAAPGPGGTRRRHAGAGGQNAILVRNAREHNLKQIDVAIPRNKFTVITGVSGSGKSTLAFDIVFAEGQRRYLESLNAYARQFVQPTARPDVDSVLGIPPTVAIEQRVSRGGRKSTAATITEIYHFFRLLYSKLGVAHCPKCRVPIKAQTVESIASDAARLFRGKTVSILAPLVVARKGYYTELAKRAERLGFGHLLVDGRLVPTNEWPRLDRFREHTISIVLPRIRVGAKPTHELVALLREAAEHGKGVLRVAEVSRKGDPWKNSEVFSTRHACPECGAGFQTPDPRLFSFNSKHGWCPACHGTGLLMSGFDEQQTGEEPWWNEWWDGDEKPCPACGGKRLNPEALSVLFMGMTIADMAAMSVRRTEAFFKRLKLRDREQDIGRDIVSEIISRLVFLREVGLDYLALDRAAPTLSGGEAQRIRLAAQLGSNLCGVCYVLDEPSIGLHARDNAMLLDTLRKLKEKGNTVIVVEHDEQTVLSADHIIDLGPGAGRHGGQVVACGTAAAVKRCDNSVTGRFLRHPLRHPLPGVERPSGAAAQTIAVKNASLHNLKNIDVSIPVGRLVCVTGVSGSGKSTLVLDVLAGGLRNLLSRERGRKRRPGIGSGAALCGCAAISGAERLSRILEVDQSPIGNTPRSCPATYVGFWSEIRRIFAEVPESRMRGFGPGRFSFNVRGGRCETCEGQGAIRMEMSFLPDVSVACETCAGLRFNETTLAAIYKGRNIAQVLAMSVDEAVGFFEAHAGVRHALKLLQDVGLGYLCLGQPSPTLSGGEAQRIKLVTELAKTGGRPAAPGTPGALYVMDEPTIGLHAADVEKLVRVLRRLVGAGNTVVVIEHNMDVIAEADRIIDLGPEGGEAGGRVVAQGPPRAVARIRGGSYTAKALAEFFRRAEKHPHAFVAE